MCISLHCPHFSLSIALVEINLWTSLQITIWYLDFYCCVCVLWYLIYFFSRSLFRTVDSETFTPALWMFLVMSWVLFFQSYLNVFDINYCYFPWPTCSISIVQHTSIFLPFEDIPNYCVGYAQCLSKGFDRFSIFSQLQIGLIFSHSSLVFISVYPF